MAVALTFALFVVWLVVGWAALSLLHTRRGLLRNLLLAPAVGVAVVALPTVALNRLGWPIAPFSLPLTALLVVASLLALWWRRPYGRGGLRNGVAPLFWRALLFVGVLLLAFALIGRPLAEFGFSWLSYANDDMANYVGDAERFARYGALEPPDVQTYVEGRDYLQPYWVFSFGGLRLGTAPLLAWVIGLTGRPGHDVFMPLTVAFHLALIWAACGLVCASRAHRLAAMVTGVVLAFSALTSLGVLYQLNAQVAGLALLAVAAVLLLRPLSWSRPALAVRHGVLTGIVVTALLICYPEVLPFLGAAFVLFHGTALLRRRAVVAVRPLLAASASALGVVLVALNTYVPSALNYLLAQTSAANPAGLGRVIDEAFPYFRIPSGLANLWGYQPLAQLPPEPWQSATILLGGAMLLAALVTALRLTWRLQPTACMALVMLLVGALLLRQGAGFGLFKLAMFAQPFLLGTLVLAWSDRTHARTPLVRLAPVLFLGLLSAPSQSMYVEASRGIGATFVELRDPSATRVNEEFRALLRQVSETPSPRLLLDTSSLVLAKLQSVYTRGGPAAFPSKNPYFGFERTPPRPMATGADLAAMQLLREQSAAYQPSALFPWFPEDQVASFAPLTPGEDPRSFVVNTIGQSDAGPTDCTHLVGLTGAQTVFNRRQAAPSPFVNFSVQPCDTVRNHLIFVDAAIAHSYYGQTDARIVSMFQLENDLFLPPATMMATGRRLLLQTVNPTDGARLALTFTSTLAADGENSLPPAVVIGQARTDLPLLGRGSARVFSPPVTPLTIHGRQYVGLDLGRDGRAFPERRRGLMSLFGVELPLDRRLIVGFTRDISLVSAEQYARLTPPQQIQTFPADLANPDLEYAGLYEDGWVAEAAFVTFAQPATESALVVRGMIPQIADAAFTTDLRVLVDGREVAQRTLPLGEFELAVDAVSRPGRRRIDLRFSAVQQLPGADRRPAAALLRFVGFEGRPADIAQAASGLRIGGNWHALEHTPDGEAFRWAENDAEITVDGVVAAGRPLVLDVEPGPGLGGQPFLLQITDDQGRRVQSATATGRVQIEAPVAADVRALRLHVDSNNLPAPNDPRILNFRVFVVAWKGSPSLLTATALRALNEPADIGPAPDRRALATGALPPDGLFVGEGWYPFEQFGGEMFRWVQNDAQIVVTAPTGARTRLRMEVEPGPGVGLAPFDLRVLDANGQTVATQPVLGRQTVEITLPVAAGSTTTFTLQAQGGGLPAPGDPRVLNFRVFAFRWVD